MLSRHAAEHLALSPTAIDALVRRCFAWFDDRGLQHPALYVPPAWGLGALPPQRLRATGFRYLETLGTVHDLISGRRRHLPVLGFEADTRLRAGLLRGLNSVSAHWPGPVRLALHPHDHRLRLAGALGARLRRVRETVDYATLLAPAALR